MNFNKELKIRRKLILEKNKNVPWMDTMVLNPAIIEKNGRIHMLFRATGTNVTGKEYFCKDPYPICLGYGWSDDGGETWQFDTERPALAPSNEFEKEKLYIRTRDGTVKVNYANGCIEDPRLFYIEGKCYLTVAVRMFPPGAYWIKDCPTQCCPDWVKGEHSFSIAAKENVTVSVLYEVDIEKLEMKEYDEAFSYITNLTNPDFGQNRDVVLFPEKMLINGKMQYVMLDRPVTPYLNPQFTEKKPSIVISAAERFEDFSRKDLPRKIFAVPEYPWENDRIGTSAPLLKIDDETWLLSYHGKQDDKVGYTQSFMLLKNRDNDYPEIIHRSGERLITVSEEWEMAKKFTIPCIFIDGMILKGDNLILSYGAADECCGIMKLSLMELLKKMNYKKNI